MIQVETFELNEEVENLLEVNEEQKDLIIELGLEGQDTLIGESKNETLLAYPEVTKEQDFIISTVCPTRCSVGTYKRTQIPLRILQIISHVRQENYFNEIYVLDKEDVAIKDPFLMGVKGSYYSGTYYLLGRWGEELESWSKLKEMAMEIVKERKLRYIKRIKNELGLFAEDDELKFSCDQFTMPSLQSF